MFQFKQFTVHQQHCAQKVSEVACVQGAWTNISDTCNTLLDIGSGTGLLSLMLAQRCPRIQIDAIEIEETCFLQGQQNVKASSFAKQITCVHADINQYFPDKKYDFICCNPPFFEAQLKSPTQKVNVAKHAAKLTFQQLLTAIDRLLNDTGSFSILFPYDRLNECVAACKIVGFYPASLLIIKHTTIHSPKVFVAIYTKEKSKQVIDELVLSQDNQRSIALQNLMHDFYL